MSNFSGFMNIKKAIHFCFKSYVLFTLLLILVIGGTLIWFVQKSSHDFVDYHNSIAKGSSAGVAEQIAFFIGEQKRLVKLFANENLPLILAVKNDPENDDVLETLDAAIFKYFPNRFAFTIADNSGEPMFEDFDGLVSDACKSDLRTFSKDKHYAPYIHPNSESYHFDVMANFGHQEGEHGILFISFHADVMGSILKSTQVLHHNIMLLYPKRKDLIEVVAEGARNHLDRLDYRLTKKEKSQILHRQPIRGTRWEAADLHHVNLFSDYESQIRNNAIFMFLLALLISLLFVNRLYREESQRKHAEAQKAAMIGLVAHEFRTPVTSILGALGLLRHMAEKKLKKNELELVDMAHANSNRLQLLVNDFLDVQTLESGNFQLDIKEVSLTDFITSALNNNKMYGDQFKVRFNLLTDVSTFKDVHFLADESRAQQVLSNLLSNAVKYGGPNKSVAISIDLTAHDVKMSVQDQGKGIPIELQSRMFQEFAKGNNQQVSGIKSTGLGLNICHKIMTKHGGKIGFTSEINKGICFFIIFRRK